MRSPRPCGRPDAGAATGGHGVPRHRPGGVFADFITAFGGIDGILLGVALGVVFVILLIVYRSPILPIAVLVTALFGLSVAALVIYPLAKNGSIDLSGQSQGILSSSWSGRDGLRATPGAAVQGGAARPRVDVGRDGDRLARPSSRSRPARRP